MSVTNLAPGSLFAGRYRVVRCIAHGGMGAVYEVIHLETERRRALKVMLPTVVQNQEMRDRFRLEARVTASIESEFLVDVSDAGIDDATQMPFLVMEFLRGEELSKRLKRMGRLEFHEVVTYLHQAAMALDKTHQASIVHRDLKPGNLFLTERDDGSPRVKVLDFGIAKLVADSTTQGGATQSLGTPLYMAPEQFKSGQRVSPASDIYSLGMLAYHLLVGKAYWAEEAAQNVFTIIAAAVNGPQESAQGRAQRAGVHLPASFDPWFFKATSVNPSERFATAGQAVRALAVSLGIQPPGRRATLFPDSQPSSGLPSIADVAPPSRGAPMITPVTPLPPMSQPSPSVRPPPVSTPPTFGPPTHASALTGSSTGFPSIPDAPPPPSAPSGPHTPFPSFGSPIQSSGSLTGSGVSHTSGMYETLERPKASKVPIMVAAGLGVGITVALLIAILPKGSSDSGDSAREPAAAATSAAESNTSSVIPAAPPPEPPAPAVTVAGPAETPSPDPSSAPAASPSSSASAAGTSKPKSTDAAGKPSRPKTPRPSVVYSPD